MTDVLILFKSAGKLIVETAGFAMSMRRTGAWPGELRQATEVRPWHMRPTVEKQPKAIAHPLQPEPLPLGGTGNAGPEAKW